MVQNHQCISNQKLRTAYPMAEIIGLQNRRFYCQDKGRAGRSFLPVGIEKGQPISRLSLCNIFMLMAAI